MFKNLFSKLALILLRILPPEISSNVALKLLSQFAEIKSLQKTKLKQNSKPLKLGNLKFDNYLGLAAGLDKEGKYYSSLSSFGFSFIEVGTFTPLSQKGNPKPRIKRLIKEKSLINSLGFNNPGIKQGVKNIKKYNKNFKGILGVSIGKNKQTSLQNAYKDYRFCMQECFEVADYLAVNISSPNTEGLRKLSSKEFLEDLICEINKEKFKLERIYSKQVPILFKLSPDESDENLKSIIDLSLSNGISGFILTNTLKADHFGMKGGISGELLKERSNLVLKKVKKIVSEECILISSGGISTKSDAEERISNGANLLQIYTSFVYKGPEIIEELLN